MNDDPTYKNQPALTLGQIAEALYGMGIANFGDTSHPKEPSMTCEIADAINDAYGVLKEHHTVFKHSDIADTAFDLLQERGALKHSLEELHQMADVVLREVRAPQEVVLELLAKPMPLSATGSARLHRAQLRCAERLVEVKAELRRRGPEC